MALSYKSSLARYRRYLQIAEEKPLWKATLFLSLSLILVVVLLVVAVRPTAMKIAEIQGKVEKQRSLSEALNDKIIKDQQAAALLEKNREKLFLLDDGLPVTSNWKTWVLSIEESAIRANVEIENLNIGENQIKGKSGPSLNGNEPEVTPLLPTGVIEVKIIMTVKGQYEQLIQFVDYLEKSRRIIVLNAVEFDKQNEGELKLVLSGSVGYFPNSINI